MKGIRITGDIDVHFSEGDIVNRFEQRKDRAQMVLKQMINKDCMDMIPLQEGVLRNSTEESLRSTEPVLIWNTPYAHYQYIGLLMVDSKTGSPYSPFGGHKVYKKPPTPLKYAQPGAMSQWFEHAKGLNKDKWIEKVKEVFLDDE